jgi:simple sugar transport system permease protein
VLGGAIRVSTPFLFVSLGEDDHREERPDQSRPPKALVFGAMIGYAVAYLTGSPWIGLIAAAASALFGAFHGWLCSFPRVNDIAIGIALMLLGTGVAFFFGKPYIQPVAPDLPAIPLGWWSDIPQLQAALKINVLFLIGIAAAVAVWWAFKKTRIGLIVRVVGDSADAARALGYNVNRVRLLSTAAGGVLAGIAGAYLSLYYPGSWNEGISSGH